MNMYKVLWICSIAMVCSAGQMPRKEVESVPSTQEVAAQEEIAKEESTKKPERRSAAKRSMDAPIEDAARKGAAKKVVEEALDL